MHTNLAPIREQLLAIAEVHGVKHMPEGDIQVVPEDPSGVGVKALHYPVDVVVVEFARIIEIRAVGIGGERVGAVDVASRRRRARRSVDVEDVESPSGLGGTPEVVGHLVVPEEESGILHTETSGTLGDTAVDEERVREAGLGEGCEETGRGKVEFGVGGNGLLDTATAEVACDFLVIEATAVGVTVLDELCEGRLDIYLV